MLAKKQFIFEIPGWPKSTSTHQKCCYHIATENSMTYKIRSKCDSITILQQCKSEINWMDKSRKKPVITAKIATFIHLSIADLSIKQDYLA